MREGGVYFLLLQLTLQEVLCLSFLSFLSQIDHGHLHSPPFTLTSHLISSQASYDGDGMRDGIFGSGDPHQQFISAVKEQEIRLTTLCTVVYLNIEVVESKGQPASDRTLSKCVDK